MNDAGNHPSPLRVLVLDDDAFMLSLLADMIEGFGPYQVDCAADGQSALAMLRAHAPQLLICDLSMPDMDGIEFLREAAEESYRGSVVLLSGVDSGVLKAAERLALAHGLAVLDALPKPLSRPALGSLLERAASPRPV